MGCILACLRFKGNDKRRNKAQLKSSPLPSKAKEPLLSEDQFVSVFISEGSTCKQVADLNFEDNRDDGIFDTEFKDQVKFLKSCGAILETPAELRKASEKLIAPTLNKEISSSDSSCIPDTVIKKLVWEEQEDSEFSQNSAAGSNFGEHQSQRHNESASKTASRVPGTRKLISDEEREHSNFERHSSAGFNVGVHQAQKHNDCTLSSASQIESESGSESAVLDASQSGDETKGSVCFGTANHDPEIESSAETTAMVDVSPSQNGAQIQVDGSKDMCLESVSHNPGSEPGIASTVYNDSLSQDDTQIQAFVGNNSPYPTPLQLTDEMGTPCTVYPSTRETPRKNARVRNQYVYPVLNPVDNPAQLKMQPAQVTSSSNNQNDKRRPDREEFGKENYSSVKKLRSLTPLSNSRWKVTSNLENPQVEVLSLSQWLKHPQRDNKKKYSRLERTPDVERPIFGVVAMHWNEEDPSKISPKLWGGNGIPNTTTKYKEDQKVSWHATPFEERLDKALSDDKLFPRRKDISRNLVAFNDEGERE